MKESHAEEVSAVRRVTCGGMAVNAAIAALKGAVGVRGHSNALLADAAHSLSDLATDFAVLFGVRFWTAPADDEHPYGHGKVQALVTLFIGAALVVVAWELVMGAVESLRTPSPAVPGVWAFWVAVASVAAKECLYRWTHRVSVKFASPALEANAWHHRSDALSSIPVAIAVAVAHFHPSLVWVDAVGAVIVSVFIAHVAWQIVKPALRELVDADVKEKTEAVTALARSVEGVCAVHKVRTRRSGGGLQADLHIEIDPNLTVARGHALGHVVKERILASDMGVTDALIHVEPFEPSAGDEGAVKTGI